MNLTGLLERCLPRCLKQAVKKKIAQRFELPSMEWSLGNIERLGFRPAGVVDIRACKGEWAHALRLMAKEELITAPTWRALQPTCLDQWALRAWAAASLAGSFGNP